MSGEGNQKSGPNSSHVFGADLVPAPGSDPVPLFTPASFSISSASQIPPTLCVCCKLSQKGGIRNCSLLSILRDGETL